MLAFYEYRILKEFSNYHSDFISIGDNEFNPNTQDKVRFIHLKGIIGHKTKIDNCLIETATEDLISLGYLNSHADVSNSGLAAIHNYPKEVLKSIFTIYLPIIFSFIAIVISVIALILD